MMEDRLVMSTVPGHPTVSGFAMIDFAKAKPKPAAPSFTANPISTTQVNLSWTKVPGASKYLIEESVRGKWVQLASLKNKTTGYTISGLTPNTNYTFDVWYVKGGRKSKEVPKAATTLPLPLPAELLSAHNGTADPLTENFGEQYFVGSGPVGPVTSDQGRPAWESTDTTIFDQLEYIDQRPLSSSQVAEIASRGFTETLVARVTRNNDLAPAWDQSSVAIGGSSTDVLYQLDGGPRFDIDLAINSNGDTVVVLPTTIGFGPGGSVVETGPTVALTDSGYHTYQLYYNPATSSANLYIDGHLALSGYTGETAFLGYSRLYWGTGGGGQGFYSLVELQTGNDIVTA